MDGRQDQQPAEPASIEQAVAETLEHGEMKRIDPAEAAMDRLSPRTVIRIKTEKDPILEEIDRYRCLAEEVDDRYDAYVDAAGRAGTGKDEQRNLPISGADRSDSR